MAADFESAKLDTYSGQRKELDRRVLSRYRVSDPELIATDEWFYDLPSYSISDVCSYADLLLASAQVLETQGDTNASEKYLSIARFGKLLRSGDRAWFGKRTQQAYARLAALAAKNSRPEERLLFILSWQIRSVKPRRRDLFSGTADSSPIE